MVKHSTEAAWTLQVFFDPCFLVMFGGHVEASETGLGNKKPALKSALNNTGVNFSSWKDELFARGPPVPIQPPVGHGVLSRPSQGLPGVV